jgi:hypothetical protein
MVITAVIGALVYGAPHVTYQVFHRAGLDGFDLGASLGGLAIFAILPVGLSLPHSLLSHGEEIRR